MAAGDFSTRVLDGALIQRGAYVWIRYRRACPIRGKRPGSARRPGSVSVLCRSLTGPGVRIRNEPAMAAIKLGRCSAGRDGPGRGPPTGGPLRSGGFGGAALLPCLFSFSWVNARAARPCPKAPPGTAKRRLQAQQKSACRYSRNSKRRLQAQQKSACRYSRS